MTHSVPFPEPGSGVGRRGLRHSDPCRWPGAGPTQARRRSPSRQTETSSRTPLPQPQEKPGESLRRLSTSPQHPCKQTRAGFPPKAANLTNWRPQKNVEGSGMNISTQRGILTWETPAESQRPTTSPRVSSLRWRAGEASSRPSTPPVQASGRQPRDGGASVSRSRRAAHGSPTLSSCLSAGHQTAAPTPASCLLWGGKGGNTKGKRNLQLASLPALRNAS